MTDYKATRERIGTQVEVAARLGVARSTVQRRELGKMVITQEAALAIRALPVGRLDGRRGPGWQNLTTAEKEMNELKSADSVRCTEWMGEPERTETVKERTQWEVRSRKPGEEWRRSGSTQSREEVDAFLKRAVADGYEVQVWWVVVVERTETVKRLEIGSPIAESSNRAR